MRLAGSVVMGLAVAGMHYAAMKGTVFASHPARWCHDAAASVGQTVLALWVTTTTFMILLLAMVAAMLDRRYALRLELEAAALRQSEERFRLLVQSVTDYAIFHARPCGARRQLERGRRTASNNIARTKSSGSRSRCSTRMRIKSRESHPCAANSPYVGEVRGGRLAGSQDGSRFWAGVVIEKFATKQAICWVSSKSPETSPPGSRPNEELEQTRAALFQAQKDGGHRPAHRRRGARLQQPADGHPRQSRTLRKRLPDDPKLCVCSTTPSRARTRRRATQRMLAFARRQHLHPEPVKLPDLVNGMSDLLNRSITSAHQIETRFPLGLPPAMVDPHQLELALLNLVVNARDAMPEGGSILIAGHARPAPEGGPAMVCLSVIRRRRRDGPGDALASDGALLYHKGRRQGHGSGPFHGQGLAEQSQGQFVITSALGEGTTAEIWLPIAVGQLQPEKEMPEQGDQTPTRSLKILLVDDDPLVLENAAALLEDLGHHVIEASSGREALAILDHAGAGRGDF